MYMNTHVKTTFGALAEDTCLTFFFFLNCVILYRLSEVRLLTLILTYNPTPP